MTGLCCKECDTVAGKAIWGRWQEMVVVGVRDEATKFARKRSHDKNEPTRDRAEFDPGSYFV